MSATKPLSATETTSDEDLQADLASGNPERIQLAKMLIERKSAGPQVRGETKDPAKKPGKKPVKGNGAARQSKPVAKQSVNGEVIPAKENGDGDKKRKQISAPTKDTDSSKKAKLNNSRLPDPESEAAQTPQTKATNESGATRATDGPPHGSFAGGPVSSPAHKESESYVELFAHLEKSLMTSLASHMDGIRTTMEHQAQELQYLRRETVDILEQQAAINKRLGWMQRDAAERGLEPKRDGKDDDEDDDEEEEVEPEGEEPEEE